ncbi:SusC/RagA family TonB-linked outer membrane protein [Flavivirga jejuensis]|uniref:TonB-dependent receptor n=1 Tax=Flavivirga jejuensis TaxID=870487 RepID=A0ABT8WQT5_9FLAO|nr:TonB-dependent receptor [Flavivirga jejuensis]MDO5975532.1 TonB-dependent receptor [Flavivirga jejuensis]
MRTFIFLCFTSVFALIPDNVVSQNSKIKIEESRTLTVDEVFDLIMDQTDYKFFYEEGIFNNLPKVELKKGIISTNKLLKKSLSLENLDITVTANNAILIKEKPKRKVIVQQGYNLKGTVKDANGQPLPGANIIEKGTTNGSQTDFDGNFSITVANKKSILVISYLGFLTSEVPVNGQTTINAALSEDSAKLDEIVVVGYGSQKKVNLTGSVVSVKGDDINKRPITQGSQALQGVASGVFINTNSGEPGADTATVNIRGIGTLNDSDPLVLIDGIEGPLNSVNSNDIESINVLKDAASASIYGTRAANGVVLITTKRGAIGAPSVTYNTYYGVTSPTVLANTVTDTKTYLETYVKAAEYSGRTHPFTPELIDEIAALGSKDWLGDYVNTGSVQNHDVAVSGGSENVKYRWSTSYLDQNSYLEGDYYLKRLNTRLNLDVKVSDKIKVGTSLSYVNTDNRQAPKNDAPATSTSRGISSAEGQGVVPTYSGDGNKGSFLFTILNVSAPNAFVYDEFGRYGGTGGESSRSQRHNPQALIDNQWVNIDGNEFLGNAFVEYAPLEGLKVRYTSAINFQQESHEDIRLEHEQYDRFGNLSATREAGSVLIARESTILNYTNWLQATYEKSIGDHNFNFLIGANQETSTVRRIATFEKGFGSTSLVRIGNGTEAVDITNYGGEWALQSVFGRLNYNYKDKYLLEANVRRDGSSRFGSESRWATFPGVSVGYVLSKEDFWKGDFVSHLKLRGSWGKLGVQSSNLYPYASEVVLGTDYDGVSGAALTKLGNPDLAWEETTVNDIGFDVKFFGGKVSLEADYYIKKSLGILTDLANPLTSGVDSDISINAASIENKGFDISLNTYHNIGDLKISIGGNVTHVKNKVLEIDPSLSSEDDRRRVGQGWLIRGEPINSFFGHEFGGIYQVEDFDTNGDLVDPLDTSWLGNNEPRAGDIKYTDQNNDGAINEDDMVVIGNPNPEWLYGFNLDFEYKRWDLGVLFQGIGTANSLVNRYTGNFGHSGLREYWLGGWTEENRSNTVPRIFVDREGWNGNTIEGVGGLAQTSNWIIDRSYLRLKNIVIGYTLPEEILEKFSIDYLRLYVSGQNLWTKSNLDDLDPERNAFTNHFAATMPQSKVITLGLNLKF